MNTNKCQHEIIFDKNRWFELLENKMYKIHRVLISEEIEGLSTHIHVTFSIEEEFHIGGLKTNVAIAAFVTANARLKLYNTINKLGKRLLYCDTDSMIFVSKKGDFMPEIGTNLGDLSSEIDPSKSQYIQIFVSAGPKNYAYKTNTGYINCCVKGITLNHLTTLVINFDSIREIVCKDQEKKILAKQLKFIRDQKFNIKTDIVDKNYGFVYDKRILNNDFTTVPYGYSEA